jgi:hypothetical protein
LRECSRTVELEDLSVDFPGQILRSRLVDDLVLQTVGVQKHGGGYKVQRAHVRLRTSLVVHDEIAAGREETSQGSQEENAETGSRLR